MIGADGTVYVGSSDASMYALNGTTGGLIWSYATSASIVASAAIGDGVLMFGSTDLNVYAIKDVPV